jgi:hypothetical protein
VVEEYRALHKISTNPNTNPTTTTTTSTSFDDDPLNYHFKTHPALGMVIVSSPAPLHYYRCAHINHRVSFLLFLFGGLRCDVLGLCCMIGCLRGVCAVFVWRLRFALRLRRVCAAFALHMCCVCAAFALRSHGVCAASARCLRGVCTTFAPRFHRISVAFARHLRCVCAPFARR